VPGLDPTPESRVKKESARFLWQKMNEPGWQKLISTLKPKSTGSNHSTGVITVDAQGNVAAILHSINTIGWGATGIFVDGISIPDSATFQQPVIAKLKPGDRLPDTTNPVIVLKNDFAEKLVDAVIAKGQEIKLLSKMESNAQLGYCVAIQIDQKTGKRVGVAPSVGNGCVAGY
jgi:hypothetical protein